MSMYFAPKFLNSEGVKRQAVDLRRSSWEASIASLRFMVNEDYSPHLPDIRQLTLVVTGKQDYTIPPTDSELAASLLPQGQLVMLDDIHHWPTDEDFPSFLYMLGAFLEKEPGEALV